MADVIRLFGNVDCGRCGVPAATHSPTTGMTTHVSPWKRPCRVKPPQPVKER